MFSLKIIIFVYILIYNKVVQTPNINPWNEKTIIKGALII